MKKLNILIMLLSLTMSAAPVPDGKIYNDSDDAVSMGSELFGCEDTSDDGWDRASDGPGQIVPYNYDYLSAKEKVQSLISAIDGAIEAQQKDTLDVNAVRRTLVLVYDYALKLNNPKWVFYTLQALLRGLSAHYQIIRTDHSGDVDLLYNYGACLDLRRRWLKMLRVQKNLA